MARYVEVTGRPLSSLAPTRRWICRLSPPGQALKAYLRLPRQASSGFMVELYVSTNARGISSGRITPTPRPQKPLINSERAIGRLATRRRSGCP